MKIKIATGPTVYKSRISQKEITVKQLYQRLEFPDIRNQKDGSYFILASFNENIRTAASLDKYYGAALDLDQVSLTVKEIQKVFRTYSYCIYSTFSHKQPGKGDRYRIVIPYKYPISPEQHREVSTYLLYKLGADNIGSDVISQKALSRPMYFPACSAKNQKHFVYAANLKSRYFDPAKAKLSPEDQFEIDQDKKEQFDINEKYDEGGRNDALARLVGKFIRNGMDYELAHQSAFTWNQTNCEPPMSKEEVKTIVDSVFNSHKRNSKDSGWGYDELKRRIDKTPNGDENYDELLQLVSGSYKKLSNSEKERLIKRISEKTKVTLRTVKSELEDKIEDRKEKDFAEEETHEELTATSLKQEFKDWVYMRRDDRFFNLQNGLVYKIDGFNRSFTSKIDKGTLSQILLKHKCVKQADMMMFNPSEESIFKMDHITYVNSYIQPELFPIPGSVKPMLDHFKYLISNRKERKIILDYIAFLVQKPGVKIRWMPVIKGPKGVGKSMIADHILAPLLGRRNVFNVDSKLLKSDFNSWQLDTQLVVFHELKTGETRKEKLALTDSIKSFITDDYITAHRKGLDEYQALNKANVFGLTNHEDAIMITQDERRFALFRIEAKPKPIEYYEELIRWLSNNKQEMLNFFLERNISRFNYQVAPWTQMTEEVKEGSMMWPNNIIKQGLDDPDSYFNKYGYCTYTGIVEYIRAHSVGNDLINIQKMESSNSSHSFVLINAIKDLGFKKWVNSGRKTDRLSIKGRSERIWVAPKFTNGRSKPIEQIRREISTHEKTIYDFSGLQES